jgi:predicted lactoylglutathione lyase
MKLYRGRILDHINIKVQDIGRSKNFYKAVFETLGHCFSQEEDNSFFIDEFKVSEDKSSCTKSLHLAFQAENPGTVNLFHETAIKAGGKCNGAPGKRKYHHNYYSAYVLDPDGNNIEAVYHGAMKRSATFIELNIGTR